MTVNPVEWPGKQMEQLGWSRWYESPASESVQCLHDSKTPSAASGHVLWSCNITSCPGVLLVARWWAAMVSEAWKTLSPYRWVGPPTYRRRIDIVDDIGRRRRASTNTTCAPYQRRITDKRGGVVHGDLLSYQLYERSISDRRASGQDDGDSTGLGNVEKEVMGIARTYVMRGTSQKRYDHGKGLLRKKYSARIV